MRVPKRGELQACVAKEADFGPRARRSGERLCAVQGQADPSAGEAQPHACSLTLSQHAEMVGGNSYFMGCSRNAGEELEGPEFSLHPTCHKLPIAFQPALSMNPSWFIEKPSSKSLGFNTCRICYGAVDGFQRAL